MIAAYRDVYEVSGLFETRLYDGVPEMLDELAGVRGDRSPSPRRSRKTPPTACSTTSASPPTSRSSAGATYDGIRRTKADVIGHALERLGVAAGPAVVMIGDRHHDIEGAAAHGIDTIAVAWGYGSADEHRDAGAWAHRRATRGRGGSRHPLSRITDRSVS